LRRLKQAAPLSRFKCRRNLTYFVHDLISEPLFRTGKPV
jgi:hypothetical protein